MPFTCDACGRRSDFPDLIPAAGDVLRCAHCARERPFVRPPLLIVTGTAGIGKSTLCARLAGTIPGAVLVDADVLAEDLVSVAGSHHDYPAFWRSMMRLAHELAQNNLVVVYFAVMLPEQALANRDLATYFDAVHFLCLTCAPDALRARIARRDGERVAASQVQLWADFNDALVAVANDVATASVVDAGRALDDIARDVREWIDAHVQSARLDQSRIVGHDAHEPRSADAEP